MPVLDVRGCRRFWRKVPRYSPHANQLRNHLEVDRFSDIEQVEGDDLTDADARHVSHATAAEADLRFARSSHRVYRTVVESQDVLFTLQVMALSSRVVALAIVLIFGTAGAVAQTRVRIMPPDGGVLAVGQRVDIRVEATSSNGVQPATLIVRINGEEVTAKNAASRRRARATS